MKSIIYITKKTFLIAFIFSFFSVQYVSGQNINITDTINVVTLQNFSVPKNKSIVLTNIRDVNFKTELLNENLQKIRDCKNDWQEPSKNEFPISGKRGQMVQYKVNESIQDEGKYYIKISINYKDEETDNKLEAYYLINVTYPTIASNINLRSDYFFSEKETFSFSTIEFSDQKSYSYRITDQNNSVLESGKGPVVNLNKIFNNESNFGKTITVIGYYKDKEFQYKDFQTSEIKKSSWIIKLQKPELDEFVNWKRKEEKGDLLLSIYNDKAMTFLYLYVGKTPSGFAVVAPKARNLNVTSEPQDFLQSFSANTSGKFLIVNLKVNQKFVEAIEDCGEEFVKVKIQFVTQFGESVIKEYYATVIK